MAEPGVIEQARTDIRPSLRKFTKKDWLLHAKALQNLAKEIRTIDDLNRKLEILIPQTKRLQEKVLEKKVKTSIWYTLNEELLALNYIDRDLEKDGKISNRILKRLAKLAKLANVEEALVRAVL